MPARIVNKLYSRMLVVVASSTAIGFLCALPYILGDGTHESPVAIMINWWLLALCLPAILVFDKALPYTAKQPLRLVTSHLAFALLITVAYVLVASNLEYALGLNKWEPWSHVLGLFNWFTQGLLAYALILGVTQSRKYFQRHVLDELRLERLERRYAEAQILAIRAQLDPHFIFNTLNAISTQLERNPKSARRMVEDLAELLRMSFDPRSRQDVSLESEIAFLMRYVDLQKARFGERLRVEVDIDPAARGALVPSLLLQPLVENAIRHGLSSRARGGRILIKAERVGEAVDIRVEDDGVGLPAGWRLETSNGLGLKATHARVLNASDTRTAAMTIGANPDGGTGVRISLPFRQDLREDLGVVSAA